MGGMCAAHAHVKRDRGGTRGKDPSAEKVTSGIYMEYICNRNRGKWFANRFIKNKKNKKREEESPANARKEELRW